MNDALDKNYDIGRERSKLTRSWVCWYVMMIFPLPLGMLFLFDGPNAVLWMGLFAGINLLVGWIPFVTNCGRCGVPFFYDLNATNRIGARMTMRRRPAKTCLGCGLDRE